MTVRIFVLFAAACALAACGKDPAPAAPTGGGDDRTAEGEVLGGSISDAMLPLETLRSQASTQRIAPTASGPSTGASGATAASSAAPSAEGDAVDAPSTAQENENEEISPPEE